MAKRKTRFNQKKPIKRKEPKFTKEELRKYGRLAWQFYIWRYINEKTGENQDHHTFRGFIREEDKHYTSIVAKTSYFHWQAVTITYYEDGDGRTYHRFGFAETTDKACINGVGIVPLITAALQEAERAGNSKQVYARAIMVAPCSRRYPNIVPLVNLRRKDLYLSERHIEEIRHYVNEKAVVYEYDPDELTDLDRQIANLLS